MHITHFSLNKEVKKTTTKNNYIRDNEITDLRTYDFTYCYLIKVCEYYIVYYVIARNQLVSSYAYDPTKEVHAMTRR